MNLWYKIPVEKILDHCHNTVCRLHLPDQGLTVRMASHNGGVSTNVGIAPGLHEVFSFDRDHHDEPTHAHT